MMEKIKKERKIPRATARRIPLYYRYLKKLDQSGKKRIKSKQFSEIIQIPSATIRRDFSHFGELGRSGYGYDVPYLLEVFSKALNTEVERKVALIGVGNLGRALINNNFRRNDNINIVCAFDNNKAVIGEKINGIEVQSMEQLTRMIKEEEIHVAISTVPSEYSQEAINQIVKSGITGILNFAPGRVSVPKEVNVKYIDLTTEVQTLFFKEDLVEL